MKSKNIYRIINLINIFILEWGIALSSHAIEVLELEKEFSLHSFAFSDNPLLKASGKPLYIENSSGKKWVIQQDFDYKEYRYFFANAFFRYFRPNSFPDMNFIVDRENNLRLGIEFMNDFSSLAEFFKGDLIALKNCFPQGCYLSMKFINLEGAEQYLVEGRKLKILDAEFLLTLTLLIGEQDGHIENIGLRPTGNKDEYLATKVDHEAALTGLVTASPLRTLAKVALGEGGSFSEVGFDYYNFNIVKLTEAFQEIAKIDLEDFESYMKKELDPLINQAQIRKTKIHFSFFENLQSMANFTIELLKERIKSCNNYAEGMQIEDAIRKQDLMQLRELFVNKKYDPNKEYEYLFLNRIELPQTLNELVGWHTTGKLKENFLDKFELEISPEEFMSKILVLDQPLIPLEMAERYKCSQSFIDKLKIMIKEHFFVVNPW